MAKTTIILTAVGGIYTLEGLKELIERAEKAGAWDGSQVESLNTSIEITIESNDDD